MKRYGNLWPDIISFPNLLLAARKAQQGKRFRENVLEFNHNLEGNLIELQTQLQEHRYQPGAYRTFEIFEPKPRIISAAPYIDRVVHHALCNVIVPLFEPTFIRDSYANRVGYGTHRALKRFVHFARNYQYILQCDIQKYFPSIDLAILKSQLRRRLKCPDTLWLIDTIIDNGNCVATPSQHFPGDDLLASLERPRGLPIGNLTSQFFANIYLSDFDHFVQEQLRASHYLRYVDDFALFSNDQGFLQAARETLEVYLDQLHLHIHPIKSQLFATSQGANFVGFRVLPEQIRVRGDSLRRGCRRLRLQRTRFLAGRLSPEAWQSSIDSWFSHLHHGDTWQLRQHLLRKTPKELNYKLG